MIAAPLAPYLAFVRRHRRTYAAAALLAVGAVVYTLIATPRRYTASVTTIVPYREVEVDLRAGQGRPFPVQYSFVVNNHLEVARGSAVPEALLAALRRDAPTLLEQLVPPGTRKRGDAAIVRALSGRLRVSSRNETGVLRIDASAPSAEGAAQLANLAMAAYAEVQQRVNQRSTKDWQSYLGREEQHWSTELQQRDEKLQHFRETESVANLIEETRLLLDQIVQLQGETSTIAGERAGWQARLETRMRQLNELRERIGAELSDSSPLLVGELRAQLARDQNWYEYLVGSGADSASVELRALRQRIDSGRRSLNAASEQVVARHTLGEEPLSLAGNLLDSVRDAEADVAARDARLKQLGAGIEALQERLERLPSLARLQTSLQREQDLVEEIYRTVHARLLEANVDIAGNADLLQAVNPAQPPRSPSAPRPLLTLASSLLLALVAATAVSALLESLDPTVQGADEAASLAGAPALCRPRADGGGVVSPEAAAALAFARALPQGGAAWLVALEGTGDPGLAQRVADRLTQSGFSAQALASPRRQGSSAHGNGVWVISAPLEDYLTGNNGATASAVLLLARTGSTRRTALHEAAALLRGAGVPVSGVLVV